MAIALAWVVVTDSIVSVPGDDDDDHHHHNGDDDGGDNGGDGDDQQGPIVSVPDTNIIKKKGTIVNFQ